MDATPALIARERAGWDETEPWLRDTFADLRRQLDRGAGRRDGPDGALYSTEFFEAHIGEVSAFIPIAGIRPDAGAELPGGPVAVTVHHGPYRELDRTYAALGSFVAERAIGTLAPIRENYLVSALDTDDEDSLVTEVCWPLRPASRRLSHARQPTNEGLKEMSSVFSDSSYGRDELAGLPPFEVGRVVSRRALVWIPASFPCGSDIRLGAFGSMRVDSPFEPSSDGENGGWRACGRLIGRGLHRGSPARISIAVRSWSADLIEVVIAPTKPRAHQWRTDRYWELAHEAVITMTGAGVAEPDTAPARACQQRRQPWPPSSEGS